MHILYADVIALFQPHRHGTLVYAHHFLGIPWGTLHKLIVPVVLAIDVYYRIEWFELNTPLHDVIAPILDGSFFYDVLQWVTGIDFDPNAVPIEVPTEGGEDVEH